MYLVDTDILVQAAVTGAKRHHLAQQWLDERLGGRGNSIGLPWPSLVGFITTMTRHVDPPVDTKSAWAQVQRWLDAPAAWTPAPGRQQPNLVTDILAELGQAPADMPDVHLAALALEHGLTLATTDPVFRRFPIIRVYDPLQLGG